MREIEFRAKAINRIPNYNYRTNYKNGDWVYGLIEKFKTDYSVAKMINTNGVSDIDVDENTLGQYTGRRDKNGTKIFKGDIVKGNFPYAKIGEIVWDNKRCGMYVKPISILGKAAYDKYYKLNSYSLEIIGNIYDNPELLKAVHNVK